MAHRICELAAWEASAWRENGRQPDCRQHRHISKLEACEKTCHGDIKTYANAVAVWIGPRAIMLTADRVWRPVQSDGAAVMQLVEGTAQPQTARRQPAKFKPAGLPVLRARKSSRIRRSFLFSS